MFRRSLLGVLACLAAMLLTAGPARAALPIVDDDPAVAARGAGDMRAVIRGSDGGLWTRTWDGSSWTSWTSLGGSLSSGPSISARPDGVYDVVARAADGSAMFKAFTPAGGWTAWESLGGVLLSAPAVSYRQETGYIDVVGVGTDRQLYFKSYVPGTGWSAWSALGGGLSGRPSMISPRPGEVEIYARGTDGQLYEQAWVPATGWTGYAALGGGLTSGVAATNWDANRRDVFTRGGDGALWLRSWTNTGGWAPWARLGGTASSGPGATAVGPNRLHVFVRGDSGRQVVVNSFSSTWTGFQSFGYAPRFSAPPPPAVVPGPTPDSSLRLNAGFGCIPVGGRVPVRIRIKARSNRLKPRVIKIVFFVDRGKHRRTDRHKPFKTRIRVSYERGSKHRVHARIFFRRKGHKRVQRKTVSKRFTMCR